MSKQNWQQTAELAVLKRRAEYITDVRLFFAERHVLEVDTPILSSSAPTAPYLTSFQTEFLPLASSQRQTYYLQTSPEFAMKRLLVAGSGPIYQLAKVFRNGEQGKSHSPEFTMLEWYRPGFNLTELMDEVATLLHHVFAINNSRRFSYQDIFAKYVQLNVFSSSDKEIEQLAKRLIPSLSTDLQLTRDGWLELLMSEVIEPQLAQLELAVFIYDFPASQAQLARISTDDSGNQVAARFEVYARGMELANGYDELLDAEELRQRFLADNRQRRELGLAEMPIDENLLSAMTSGLPPCAGVAVGFDRLLMTVLDKYSIHQVQSMHTQ